VRSTRAETGVPLDAPAAVSLWTDVGRWASFVEGFAHAVEISPDWPAEGSKVVWQSTPDGRGRVTEKALESSATHFRTRVFEEALIGEQTVTAFVGPNGTRVALELSYELAQGGPMGAVKDMLFIRSALRDALGRTLRRFRVEAEEEAGLR